MGALGRKVLELEFYQFTLIPYYLDCLLPNESISRVFERYRSVERVITEECFLQNKTKTRRQRGHSGYLLDLIYEHGTISWGSPLIGPPLIHIHSHTIRGDEKKTSV